MTLTLNGPQKKALRIALMDAYPDWDELKKLLSDQLDMKLGRITSQAKNLDTNASDIVDHAIAKGYITQLILAARTEAPGNPALLKFAAAHGLASVSTQNLEKIVGPNNAFLDPRVFAEGLTFAEWRVCRIDYLDQGIGTGFLVGPDLVLTNHHVVERLLEDPEASAGWECRFDLKRAANGALLANGQTVSFHSDWCVDASPPSPHDEEPDPKPDPEDDELDFALIRLAKRMGDESAGSDKSETARGFVELRAKPVNYVSKRVVLIMQHPKALPMKLAFSAEQTITVNARQNRIRYTLPTEPGSSGSPVFDGEWNLIALHHSGDPKKENPAYNEGIPIHLIAKRPKVAAAISENA